MTDDDLERFFAALASRAGTPPIPADEAEAVLDLTRVVAHGFQRRYAPVAAYAAGIAIAEGTPSEERVERIRAVLAGVQDLLRTRVVDEPDPGPHP